MLEELARKATGHPQAFVYYIEGDGPEYKMLVPGEGVQYLGSSAQEAEQELKRMVREAPDRRIILVMVLALGLGICLAPRAQAQSRWETATNVGLRTFDTVQTCYHLNTLGWRERMLPTQSCAGVAAINAGWAGSAFLADRWLARHGHPEFAHLQIASAGGAGWGIVYTYTIGRRRGR